MYKVFAKTKNGIVTAINSDAFLSETDGWAQIDEGETDRHHHAQGNYFPQPIMTFEGVPRYKLVDGKAIERTAEEIQADIDAIPSPPLSPLDALKFQIAELEDRNEMYSDLIQEMAMIVYA